MSKKQFNARLDKQIIDELDKEAEATGRSKTWIVSAALSKYLDLPHEARDIEALSERVNRLEAKIEKMSNSTHKKTPTKK